MTKIVWTIAWIVVVSWSAMAAMTYWVLGGIAGLAARNADQFSTEPQMVEWLSEIALVTQSMGTAAIAIVWALVSVGILICAWLITRLISPTRLTPPSSGRNDLA